MTASKLLAITSAALIAAGCVIPVGSDPLPAAAPVAKGRHGASEARILDLINAERRHNSLPVLVFNEQLDEMAKIQAQNMAYFQKMAHVIPQATFPTLTDRARHVAYPYGRLAENVALGYPDAETVVQGWMTSKGHRGTSSAPTSSRPVSLSPGPPPAASTTARSSEGVLTRSSGT